MSYVKNLLSANSVLRKAPTLIPDTIVAEKKLEVCVDNVYKVKHRNET